MPIKEKNDEKWVDETFNRVNEKLLASVPRTIGKLPHPYQVKFI